MATLRIRVQPRARRNEIVGMRGDVLVVRVTAPPVEGKANAAVVALLADRLGVRKSAVRIARGESGRDKLVEIEGIDAEEISRRLGSS